MKFHIKKIVLWLKNGKKRVLKFKPNKVNVITGESSTGKTEILEIIDYCFFSSDSKISESIVNENVAWYGLVFNINDKNYTVARKSLNLGIVSNDYYFSSQGKVPDSLSDNNTEKGIKALLESEFSIDNSVSIPYGSNLIKAGSKISLRYFLMFNTISVNIIENDTGVYFDKQHESRYRDALPRIFDLAVGIETIENILKKEKKIELELKLSKLKKKLISISHKSDTFKDEQEFMIQEAKEYSLIDSTLDLNSSLDSLKNIILNVDSQLDSNIPNDINEQEIYLKERKIANLRRFIKEYSIYKKNLNTTLDSLKPIEFLSKKDESLLKTSIFDDVIILFSNELEEIKNACKDKSPILSQVNDEIKSLESELNVLKERQAIVPKTNKNFKSVKEKFFFLGEVKTKMDLYSSSESSIEAVTDSAIEELAKNISLIDVIDNTEKRDLTVKLIEEIILDYIQYVDGALENYSDYKPVFNYTKKSLSLRKAQTTYIENVGSSSNHVFLQLFFTLAMHESAFKNKSPFIAPYLVIDQPSRPYWGKDTAKKDDFQSTDDYKIKTIFKLLDMFIQTRIENSGSFQMIVFEHVPKEYFSELDNFHLVKEFTNGEALIPAEMLNDL